MNRYRRDAAYWAKAARHLSNEAFGILARLNDHYILTGAPIPTEPAAIAKILDIPMARLEPDGTVTAAGEAPLASRELLVAMAVLAEFFKPFDEGGAIPRHSEQSIAYLRRRRERMRHLRLAQAIKATQIPVSFDDAITFTATSFDGPLAGPEPRIPLYTHHRPAKKAVPVVAPSSDDNPALMLGGAIETPQRAPGATAPGIGDAKATGKLFADVNPTSARITPNDLWMAAGRVLDRLNELTGKHFRLMNPAGGATPNADFMTARMREGYSEGDLIAVAENRAKAWQGTKMQPYLRPKTLFNKTNFATYLGDVQSEAAAPTQAAKAWGNGLDLGEENAKS